MIESSLMHMLSGVWLDLSEFSAPKEARTVLNTELVFPGRTFGTSYRMALAQGISQSDLDSPYQSASAFRSNW